jgi:hypothetical protein
MSRFQVAHEIERLNTDQFTDRLDVLGLDPGRLPSIINRITRAIFQASTTGSHEATGGGR